MDNTDIRPDLGKVDLTGVNLREANLSKAELWGSDFSKADLSKADLWRADFSKADLWRADFTGANLTGADFTGANLTGTDFTGANLREANFIKAHIDGGFFPEANLEGANLSEGYLCGAFLIKANLFRANLSKANLFGANFTNANLELASLEGVDLTKAYLRGASLREAFLTGADLTEADLTGADLAGAKLERSILINTICNKTIFTGSRIHGISVWDLQLEEAQQADLVITPSGQPDITVDNLEVAQFIYLLLNNSRIRGVIDTITSTVVLILGRFTPERKVVLDALRGELRHHNLTPVLFDFAIPADRDITETVTLLARMARFIVADLTDPASIPMELQAIAPDVAVPIRSLVHKDQKPFSMFGTLKKYHWVLPPYRYNSMDELLANLQGEVIAPAEIKLRELKESRL